MPEPETRSAPVDLDLFRPILERHAPQGRTALLPALIEAQQVYCYLPESMAAAVGKALGVSLAEVHGGFVALRKAVTQMGPAGVIAEIKVSNLVGRGGAAFPVLDDNPMYVRDYSKCVLCWRCVQVCAEDAQYTFAISLAERGFETHIATFFDKPMPQTTCVFCGQCAGVCPTHALKPKREWLIEQGYSPEETMGMTRSGRKRKRLAE